MTAPIRTTTIRIKPGEFTGTDYIVSLEQDLVEDYYVEILHNATQGNVTALNNVNHARVTMDPFGNYGASSKSAEIQISREASNSNTEHTIIIHECTDNTHNSGFITRGVFSLSAADQVPTVSATHSGVVDSDQCQAVLAGITYADATNWKQNSGYARLNHDSVNVALERVVQYDHGVIDASVYLIEWGSNVSVQLVEFDATFGATSTLSATEDWSNVSISSVTAAETYLQGTFTMNSTSNNGITSENIAYVLGDGVTFNDTETEISVGLMNGSPATKGWIYVISSPDWYVTRTKSGYDEIIQEDTESATFSIAGAAGTETYEDNIEEERVYSSRCLRYTTSVNSNKVGYTRDAVIITADTTASYHRRTVPSGGGQAEGAAFISVTDYAGNPVGDINDISASNSTASISVSAGIVVDVENTDVVVSVRDSDSRLVASATVTISIGGIEVATGISNDQGEVTLTVANSTSGTQSLSIAMGPSEVVMSPAPEIVFATAPLNYGKRVGMNGAVVTDWSNQDPFIDLMLGGRGPNIRDTNDSGFHDDALIDIDASGWQKTCVSGHELNYVIVSTKTSRPAGNYVLTYNGGVAGWTSSELRMTGNVTETSKSAGEIAFYYEGSGNMFLTFAPGATSGNMNSTNYMKDIQVLHEDDVATYDRSVQMWRPEFLASLEDIEIFRAMDFTVTNHSQITDWADRVVEGASNCMIRVERAAYPGVYTFKGMALEWVADLCNKTNMDLWYNLPHMATNDYVTQAATLIKANLNSNLRCFFEYTNEAWNSQFEQQAYRETTLIPYYGLTATGNAWNQAYATRACEMFSLIDDVYGADLHLRERVLAGQGGNPNMAADLTESDVSIAVSPTLTGIAADHADYYAFGAYMGDSVDESSAAAAFDAMVADSEDKMTLVTGEIALNVAGLAGEGKLLPICYEGGQHLVEGSNLTAALISDTNRLPGMREAMYNHIVGWDANTASGPFCAYNHTLASGTGGQWGFAWDLEAWVEDPGPENYKAWGFKDWIATMPLEDSSSDATVPRNDAFTGGKAWSNLRGMPRNILARGDMETSSVSVTAVDTDFTVIGAPGEGFRIVVFAAVQDGADMAGKLYKVSSSGEVVGPIFNSTLGGMPIFLGDNEALIYRATDFTSSRTIGVYFSTEHIR